MQLLSNHLDMKKQREILHKSLDIILDYLAVNQNPNQKVLNYLDTNVLKQNIDFNLPAEGESLEKLIPLIELYLKYSVRTSSPQFLNHLWGGFEISGLLAEMITSVTNTSMTLYESAPVALLMEQEIITAFNKLVGFDSGEGLMVTGGSNGNLIAMLCGRNKYLPEVKSQGLKNVDLVAFVSDQSHFSFLKAANVLGIGMANIIKIKSDVQGRMIPQELEIAIKASVQQGKTPFFVGATAGSSVLGAFDPILSIAQITQQYNLWFHIDGAWGGPVLFSQKHKHLLQGSELADSFSWDAHKLMGVPLICSVFLVKEKGILSQACSSQGTDYVHDQENTTDDYNPVQMSLQCSRRVDSLKLWLSWQSHGYLGYEKMVDSLFDLAQYTTKCIEQSKHLELMVEPEFLNICFRYHPHDDNISLNLLDKINLEIRNYLLDSGETFVNYSQYQEQTVIRLILTNFNIQPTDIDRFLEKLIFAGKLCYEKIKS